MSRKSEISQTKFVVAKQIWKIYLFSWETGDPEPKTQGFPFRSPASISMVMAFSTLPRHNNSQGCRN